MCRRWLRFTSLVGCALSMAWVAMPQMRATCYGQDALELSGPEQVVPPPQPEVAQVDAPSDLPEGAEVLLTGPLHEAFAEQFSTQPEPGIIISKKPPELIEEVPPEYRPEGTDIAWIPGYWGWDPEREDFLWVTGIWRQAPPDRNWVPGYWAEVAEGYQWIAGFWAENAVQEIRYLPPPPEPLVAEASTPAPSEDHFWIPGQWTYVNNDYQWRAGYWTMGYPDWVWVPDRYVWTPLGCIYRAGYWDYVVAERGTVFCPVYYSQPVVVNYRLRPSYVVTTGPTLLANLFVYPRYHHYFFGNYYSSRFLGQTMYPWVTYAQQGPGRRFDPLYGYYQTQYRDADYLTRLVRLHNYYASNVTYQPPRTLNAQLQHHHDIHDRQDLLFQAMQLNKMVKVNNNVHHHMRLVRLADNERQQLERGLDPARQLRLQRAEIEARARLANGNDRNDRNNNRLDGNQRRWNLPQLQGETRLGSVVVDSTRPERRANDGQARNNGRDNDTVNNRDGNRGRESNNPNTQDTAGRNNNRDAGRDNNRDNGRDTANRDTANRDTANRDTANRDTANRDTNRDGIVDGRDNGNRDMRDRDPANPNGQNRDGQNRDGLGGIGRDALGQDSPGRDAPNRNPGSRDATGRDATGRNPNAQDALNRDPLNRDPQNRDPQNRDPQNRDPQNRDPLNRDPQNRDPQNRDPLNRDPLNRDPLNRGPLNRGPLNGNPNTRDGSPGTNQGKGRPDDGPPSSGRMRNPLDARTLPSPNGPGSSVLPGSSNNRGNNNPGKNNPGNNNPGISSPRINPGNNSLQNNDTGKANPGNRPGNTPGNTPGIVPTPSGKTNLGGAQPDTRNPLGRGNERTRDNNGPGLPGRSPGLPGSLSNPSSNPGSAPRSNPGLNVPPSSRNDANDRNRSPRLNSGQGIAPGEPNPGAARRSPSVPNDIRNDMKQMRDVSQRQLERRAESNSAPRRAPQAPSGQPGQPDKPGKGKDKDK